MISLKHLKDKKCLDCGSDIRSVSIDGLHCNGEQFESIIYRCGCRVRYVPNFSRSETDVECPKSKKAIADKENTINLILGIRDLVAGSKVRKSVKDRILSTLEQLC